MDPTRFVQSRWSMIFERQAGLSQVDYGSRIEDMVIRRVSDLEMSIHEVAEMAAALVKMPEPERPAEAYYVCVVLLASAKNPSVWSRDVLARVFTLEAQAFQAATSAPTGAVCEWTESSTHVNLGLTIPARPDRFLECVGSVLSNGRERNGGGRYGDDA